MKMFLLGILGTAFLVSCSAPRSAPVSSVTPAPGKPLPPAKDPFAIRKQTSDEKERAEIVADAYFTSLMFSIVDLDDKASSPEIIAKAAISENRDLLRLKTKAETAHIAASSAIGNDVVLTKLAHLPDADDIDTATTMVIRLRKEKVRITPDRNLYNAQRQKLAEQAKSGRRTIQTDEEAEAFRQKQKSETSAGNLF